MTKKHYVVLAAHYRSMLNDATAGDVKTALTDMVKITAVVLKTQNNNFDLDRFLLACGITER
jgi:hypothetical protein